MMNSSLFYVYMVRCSDSSLYTGFTVDVENRVREHNTSDKRGAKYTKSRRPVKLVYFEIQSSKSNAMKRETEIKRMSKQQKEELVCSTKNLMR